jgi:hypothetical protein
MTIHTPNMDKPLAEADCIALAAWTDNEIERLRSVRKWITSTYLPNGFASFSHRLPKTPFTMTDALEQLMRRRRVADKRLLEMLTQIADALHRGKKSGFKHPLHEEL